MPFWSQNVLVASIVTILVASTSLHCYAQEPDPAKAYASLAGKTVKDIIKSMQATGDELMGRDTSHKNGLIIRAANESNALAANIDFRLHDRIDQVFDRLTENEKATLIAAEQMRLQLVQTRAVVYDIRQATILDLNSMVDRLPLVRDKFFVQAIKGVAYIPKEGNYKFKLYASQLGITNNKQPSIHLTLDGKPVRLERVDLTSERGVATVEIPNAVFAPYFPEKELNKVNSEIQVLIPKSGLLGRSHTYRIPLYLTFYPRIAGEVNISGFKPSYAWFPIAGGPIIEQMWTSNDGRSQKLRPASSATDVHSFNDIHYSLSRGSTLKSGYQRIRMAQLVGPSGLVATSKINLNKFHFPAAISISNLRTEVDASWVASTKPELWKLLIYLDEYKQTGTAPWQSSTQVFHYDEVLNILTVPAELNAPTLHIKTFTGLNYSVPVGAIDPHGFLNYSGMSNDSATVKRLQFQGGYPNDVDL